MSSRDVEALEKTLKWFVNARRECEPARRNFPYVCMEDFVLKHGRSQTPIELPPGVLKGPYRSCYLNAFREVGRDPEKWVYCEGFAFGAGLPVLHAWMTYADDPSVCIDVTWRYREFSDAYIGVAFSWEYVSYCALTYEHYALIDVWEHGWPLLSGEHDVASALHPSANSAFCLPQQGITLSYDDSEVGVDQQKENNVAHLYNERHFSRKVTSTNVGIRKKKRGGISIA